ncbi:MAG: hypothetical protein GY812_11305 [Actinomycetia bacterium]|nr:hypothetical protein [Actinomycetes bacterium]
MRKRRCLMPALAVVAGLALVGSGCGDDVASSASTTASSEETAQRPGIPTPEASTLEELLAIERPVVVGHAGGDRSWPHSTMFGFHEAARSGADVLEMDVQLTGDGVLVVHHDDTVDATTGTTGRVRELTYDELQALDSGYWWSDDLGDRSRPEAEYSYRGVRTGAVEPPEGYAADDFRVETFRAVAEAFPDHVLDVEIKVPRGDDGEDDVEFAIEAARVLAAEIEELGRSDSVVVVSFDDEVIAAFHELAPDVPTSPGTNALPAWFLEGAALLPSDRILQIPPDFDGIDVLALDGFLEQAQQEGLSIWVWPNDASTQENPDFYEELLEFDIDGVIAGHPDQAVERYRELGLTPT